MYDLDDNAHDTFYWTKSNGERDHVQKFKTHMSVAEFERQKWYT